MLAASVCAAAGQPSVSIDVASREYDSRETDDGQLLNREQGRLHGFSFTVAADAWGGSWALQAGNESGALTYAGVTQVGLPVITITDLTVQRVAVRWTPSWRPTISFATLQGHAELAHQNIERAIRRGPLSLPLTEDMSALWLRGGARLQIPVFAHWYLLADAQMSWALRQELKVNSFGEYDKFALEPKARASWLVGAGIGWQPIANVHITLRASRERWNFGRASAQDVFKGGVLAGSAEYPGSRQHLDGFNLELKYMF